MSQAISTNYRELLPSEVERVAQECQSAWQDPEIPRRQYDLAVKGELEKFRKGEPVAPFDALVRCIKAIPGILEPRGIISTTRQITDAEATEIRTRFEKRYSQWPPPMILTEGINWEPLLLRLLDVGASAGYYSEVMKIAGMRFHYTACDYSPAFKALAEELYPGIDFHIADATDLPFDDGAADIVLSGACIMHVAEYEKAIQEAARVAKRYVIFHRSPVFTDQATTFYEKEAYGVRCLEIHFNERELLGLFADCGLSLLHTETVFWNDGERFGHKTYLLSKQSIGEREWERA